MIQSLQYNIIGEFMIEDGDSEGHPFQMEMFDFKKLAQLLDLLKTKELVFVSVGMGNILVRVSKDEDDRYSAFGRQRAEEGYFSHPTATAIAYGLQAMDYAKKETTAENPEL